MIDVLEGTCHAWWHRDDTWHALRPYMELYRGEVQRSSTGGTNMFWSRQKRPTFIFLQGRSILQFVGGQVRASDHGFRLSLLFLATLCLLLCALHLLFASHTCSCGWGAWLGRPLWQTLWWGLHSSCHRCTAGFLCTNKLLCLAQSRQVGELAWSVSQIDARCIIQSKFSCSSPRNVLPLARIEAYSRPN